MSQISNSIHYQCKLSKTVVKRTTIVVTNKMQKMEYQRLDRSNGQIKSNVLSLWLRDDDLCQSLYWRIILGIIAAICLDRNYNKSNERRALACYKTRKLIQITILLTLIHKNISTDDDMFMHNKQKIRLCNQYKTNLYGINLLLKDSLFYGKKIITILLQ